MYAVPFWIHSSAFVAFLACLVLEMKTFSWLSVTAKDAVCLTGARETEPHMRSCIRARRGLQGSLMCNSAFMLSLQTYLTTPLNVFFFFSSNLYCLEHNWSSAANRVSSANAALSLRRGWQAG